jgi:SET domain-containing protein 6
MAAWKSPLGCYESAYDAAPFLRWCEKHNVSFPGCSISTCKDTGRCVLASKDIKNGEVVVEVPDEAVLMGESCGIAEKLAGGRRRSPARRSWRFGPGRPPSAASCCLRRVPAAPAPTAPPPLPPAAVGLLKGPGTDAILEVLGLVVAVMYEKARGPKSK